MLKKYLQFIKESTIQEIEKKHHSIGEYIEDVTGDNEYLLNIISQYTQGIDSTIRLANAINILDKNKQSELLSRVETYINKEEQPQDIDITAYTSANISENQDTIAGKNLFKCFLKVLTALGQQSIKIDWKQTPDTFLYYFTTEDKPVQLVKSIMTRYRQFDLMANSIDYTNNDCKLYFGIKLDLTLEYGIKSETEVIPMGMFKLSKGILNWILVLDSPSSLNLKKQLVGIDFKTLQLMCLIKKEMSKFTLGQSAKKMAPQISNNIMTFGYYGYGKWDNGVLDAGEVENVKTQFRNFLMKFKWSEKVQISVQHNDFWVFLNIKIK